MASSEPHSLAQLPDEMFSIIKAASAGIAPRLGRLSLPGRKVIETPHYLAITSRGAVPHITQDTYVRDTNISGVYVGLEDCEYFQQSTQADSADVYTYLQNERGPAQVPPIYKFNPPDGASPLRCFIALPEISLLVLGARRIPPVAAPSANPNRTDSIAVCTAVGFKTLEAVDYADAAKHLQPDVVVGLGDVPHGRSLGSKRIEKATDRTIQWMSDHVQSRRETAKEHNAKQAKLFAPLLPVSCLNQQYYIESLTGELADEVSGLAIYDLISIEDLPEALQHLPRLDLTAPQTPHEVLRRIALGMDILTLPFVTAATDAGIALSFTFPARTASVTNGSYTEALPLGTDMWPAHHAIDVSPLAEGCDCYSCTNHHRAYLQHLLAAKEMLAWVLLQIHNHCVIDRFFQAIRQSITDTTFVEDAEAFRKTYDSAMPESTGLGPRIRGYQFKSEGRGESKKNKAPFGRLHEVKEKLPDSALPDADASADVLEEHGFAEKQQ
ncbi:hypothetical protein LTR97_009275 [Elasticomyces elasticus]|uniref:Queuine tRNA-ribosyltransferase accessory subunit 2 n=1 Tax=Elasticomyces elasticus TaxID=574655 RepID=A0AAN7ZS08_9PEZI|nr:hypothetical protein LTR97_009275 [Elasticomyces elasticus]